MAKLTDVIKGFECCREHDIGACCECPYDGAHCASNLREDVLALLKEQVPRILSLEEAIEGKNGLEIDPYVFVEAKYSKDIFIGSVSDVTHYNYPDRKFSIRESFRIDRAFPAGTVYSKTDYMKVVRCWTHIPTAEQRKEAAWNDEEEPLESLEQLFRHRK